LWAKGLNTEDNNKEMFPCYGGKCLSRKAVRNCVEKFSQGHSKVADNARPGAEVVETTVKKNLHAAGFDALVKQWDKRISVGEGYVEKCFSQVRISHVLRFTSICDLFTDASSYFLQMNIIDAYAFGECCHIKVICEAIQIHIFDLP
jgi:hypothetical protein